MVINPFWKLSPAFSIHEAALLMAGRDPSAFKYNRQSEIEDEVPDYTVLTAALCHATEIGRLQTIQTIFDSSGFDGPPDLDVRRTRIAVEELARFTQSEGLSFDVFQRGPAVARAGRSGPFYSVKLHAANRVWESVTADPSLLRGKSPKKAMIDWLSDHAGELGLLNAKGEPNATGIEEIAKVANWKPEGGATPTPGPLAPRQEPREGFSDDLDDEIPF